MSTWHTYPTGDYIEHDTESEDCICGPTVEHITTDAGGDAWLLTHHSLDNRKAHEET